MNSISKALLRLAALAALTTAFGLAQEISVYGTIPFDFNVGKTTLPAGYYTIHSDEKCGCLEVRDGQSHLRAIMLGYDASKPSNPQESQVSFRVYGNTHYLASVWNGATGAGRSFNKTAAERETEMASVPAKVTVLVAQK